MLSAKRHKLTTACLVAVCLGASLAALVPTPSRAQDDSAGYLIVRSAYADLISGVFYLNALLDLRPSDEALEALNKGITLTFELQIEIERKRRFWFDKVDAGLEQKYELTYHALSQRYILLNLNSGDQQSFLTLNSMLAQLSNITSLPFLDEALLEPDSEYLIRLRVVLDNKSTPAALRMFSNWFTSWPMTSEWFEWQLSP